ncbi:MAG: hypothetical protein LKJ69_06425 [Lactobacillus sp.]|nr:hypothetical protein [Lactobacillus sp.]
MRIFSKVGFLLVGVLILLVWAPRQGHASTLLPPKVNVVDEAGNKQDDFDITVLDIAQIHMDSVVEHMLAD